MTDLNLKRMVQACSPPKNSSSSSFTSTDSAKREEIFLRYLTFYCNMAEAVIAEYLNVSNKDNLLDKQQKLSYPIGSIYHELFDQEIQVSSKLLLRSQWNNNDKYIKRLKHAFDTIRQKEFDSSISSIHDEMKDDLSSSSTTGSTPKKIIDDYASQSNVYVAAPPFTAIPYGDNQEQVQDLEKLTDNEFAKDDDNNDDNFTKHLPVSNSNNLDDKNIIEHSTSNHSIASYRSANSGVDVSPSSAQHSEHNRFADEQPSIFLSPLQSPEKNDV